MKKKKKIILEGSIAQIEKDVAKYNIRGLLCLHSKFNTLWCTPQEIKKKIMIKYFKIIKPYKNMMQMLNSV